MKTNTISHLLFLAFSLLMSSCSTDIDTNKTSTKKFELINKRKGNPSLHLDENLLCNVKANRFKEIARHKFIENKKFKNKMVFHPYYRAKNKKHLKAINKGKQRTMSYSKQYSQAAIKKSKEVYKQYLRERIDLKKQYGKNQKLLLKKLFQRKMKLLYDKNL